MAKFLQLVNGIPRSVEESGSPTIYDETISIVASGAVSPNLNGPVIAGTTITLPNGRTFVGDELRLSLNGLLLDDIFDYNIISSTTIQLTFDLQVADNLRFFIDRGP